MSTTTTRSTSTWMRCPSDVGDVVIGKGDKVTVRGWRGAHVFLAKTHPNETDPVGWVNVIRADGRGGVRSVTPDRITKRAKDRI